MQKSPNKNNVYFANKESDDKAGILLGKAHNWFMSMDSNGYLNKLKMMWAAYYGAYYASVGDSHTIRFDGEQGELVQLAVNEMRNIAQHMLVYVTSARPSMRARSINTDYKSLVQTKLANSLLDYYLREKRLEKYLRNAVESAIVLGSGYVKMEWNAKAGKVVEYDEDTNEDIYEGDIEFSNLSPFDVIFDVNREDDKHDWILCRSFTKNRYDLIAKYPEYEEEILRLPSKSQLESFHLDTFSYQDTDLIPIYEFYHRATDAVPEGNYMLFLSENIILKDEAMPYRSLPIYKVSPSTIMGTPYGYSNMFDLLPIQDVLNSLYSAVATNQAAFAVQNIVATKGSGLNLQEISSGMNLMEINPGADIKPLQLTSSPKEVFDMIGLLKKDLETLSGVNSVSRGNPDPNLRSGNALALVQSMTLQFMSGLQQSYVAVIEDIGTGLINTFKDFAKVPRMAMITGKTNRTYLKEFTGDDLTSINRVIVDIGNPLSQTTAGRVEMAEQLLQMGAIKSPEQYFTVINTGQLDVMTEDTQSQLFLIKSENERLVSEEPVIALATDDHSLHIREHNSVLSDPELRFDPDLVQRTLNHIQEHINLLRTTDPALLQMWNQQPLGPAGGSPANQATPDMNNVQGNAVESTMGGAPVATAMDQSGQVPTNLPEPAQPPMVNGQQLPTTPEEALMNQTGG